jgi:flagellar hook-length control protein FliK
MLTSASVSEEVNSAGGENNKAGNLVPRLALQPVTPQISTDEVGQTWISGRDAATPAVDALDSLGKSQKAEAIAEKLKGEASIKNSFSLSPMPGDSNVVVARDAQPESFSATSESEGKPSLLLSSLQRDNAPASRVKREAALPLIQPGEPRTPLATNSAKPVERVLLEITPPEKTREAEPPPSPVLTGGEQTTNTIVGHASTSAAPSQPSGQENRAYLDNWQAVVDQVSDGIVTKMQDNSREAHLQLSPPELGRLDIQLVVEGERVQAHIVAESKDVGVLIQSHLPELKQALQNHRLDLDSIRVDVQTSGGNPHSSSQQFGQEARPSGRRQFVTLSQGDEAEDEPSHIATPIQPQGRISVWA